MTRILPVEAHCAVGPDGKIDIDLIRRSQASCHTAAQNIQGGTWAGLVRNGWRVVRVVIGPVAEVEAAPLDVAVAPSRPVAAVADSPPSPIRMRRCAAPAAGAGTSLLRCGRLP